ncbi:MAG TPA: tetratricopeptide repeat protein [Gemmatimonadaceae bacterium]|nr:tetratricopeptide repeat protein [Gemmatimonadaceae bacterium]
MSQTAEQPSPDVEATSLLGRPLSRPALPEDTRRRYEEALVEARQRSYADPGDADALIWLGRRTAYLGRYREAIEIYTRGVQRHSRDARFYRHRGHRYITVRELDRAIADLERAASLIAGDPDEIEPDGLPNARNIPTSTLQSNIWYHLGLAHYLKGDFERALRAYRSCMDVSKNPDMLVATSHWLYMTLRRLGRDAEAANVLEPIRADLDVIENGAYHRLLLMYKGELPVDSLLSTSSSAALDDVTTAYGVGNWYFYNGDSARALEIFERIVAAGNWAAFGAIAAEAELARRAGEQGTRNEEVNRARATQSASSFLLPRSLSRGVGRLSDLGKWHHSPV